MFKKFHKANGLLLLNVLRHGIRYASLLSPSLGARLVYRLWFMSRRFDEPGRERLWRHNARITVFHVGPTAVQIYRWGEGPTVLLVHGWSGRGPQLGAFVQPLLAAGYSVLTFDAPGHGASPGDSTNAYEVADVIQALSLHFGPFKAIIAHSFGVLCAVRALHLGLDTGSFVSISSPTQARWLLDLFYEHFPVPDAVKQLFEKRLIQEFGPQLWQNLAAETLARDLTIPALIIHDADDADVTWQQSRLLADAWPGSNYVQTTGLGHIRILRDAQVLGQVVEFIRQQASATENNAT